MEQKPAERKSFYSSKLKKAIYLNPFTIADDDWRAERFTADEQIQGLKKFDTAIILALLWRAIDDDGKRLIANVKVVRWEGMKEIAQDFDSPEEKIKYVLSGSREIFSAWKALIDTLNSSVPDELVNDKKKVTADESLQESKHTTSLPQNMESASNNLTSSP